jgi:hypothetical protein
MASPRAMKPDEKNASEKAAGPAGAAAGALAGGTVGTLVAGPIGTAIGALAGSVGGWWATRGVADAVPTDEDERLYRQHYSTSAAPGARSASGDAQSIPEREAAIPKSFDVVRPAYHLGHIAARNPAYAGKRFEEIEDDLLKAWSNDLRDSHGEWASVRGYAQEAYAQRPRGQR